MTLSIIILNYKTKGLLKQSLKGLKLLKLPFNFEVIVVDNASCDGTAQMIKEEFPEINPTPCLPHNKEISAQDKPRALTVGSGEVFSRCGIKFIASRKNIGMGAGNNLGIREAKGKYILILNPDVISLLDSIEKLIELAEKNPQAGIIGPRLVNPNGTLQFTCFRFPKFSTPLYRRTFLGRTKKGRNHLKWYTYQDFPLNQPQKVDWIIGAAILIRKKVLDEIGLFDERFFLFFEDTDLARRVWQKGFEVWYLPQSKMVHYPQRLSAEYRGLKDLFHKATWFHISSWLKYFWKWRK